MADQVLFIDCDPGIDDMHALLMAFRQPGWRIVGLSSVCGNVSVDLCTSNLFRILTLADQRHLRVHRGASASLRGEHKNAAHFHGEDGLGDEAHRLPTGEMRVESSSGPDALLMAAEEHCGRLVLVCLGPLTNVALALQKDSRLGRKLSRCVIMGGNEKLGNITDWAEFNFYQDPEAARVVLEQLDCPMSIVTWDLSVHMAISLERYLSMFETETQLSRALHLVSHEAVKRWCSSGRDYTPCDQLAMAVALQPSIVRRADRHRLSVDTSDEESRGRMLLGEQGDIEVVREMDPDEFYRMASACLL